jgi:hypothetical protein
MEVKLPSEKDEFLLILTNEEGHVFLQQVIDTKILKEESEFFKTMLSVQMNEVNPIQLR